MAWQLPDLGFVLLSDAGELVHTITDERVLLAAGDELAFDDDGKGFVVHGDTVRWTDEYFSYHIDIRDGAAFQVARDGTTQDPPHTTFRTS